MGKSKLDREKQEKKNSEARDKAGAKPDAAAGVTAEQGKTETEGAITSKTPAKPKKARRAKGDATADCAQDDAQCKGARKALRKAMKAKVKEECKEIAITLVNKVKAGDMRSAEMMMSLVERKKKDGKEAQKKRDGLSDAELMASEPEWDAEQERLMRLAPTVQSS